MRRTSRTRLASLSLVLLLSLSPQLSRAASGRTTTQRPPGYLGIEFHDLTAEQAESLHLRGPEGVEVLLVDHDGPAAAAGLRPHDLITGINGHAVASGEALRRTIRETGAGVQVTLAVFRNGNPITIRTKLANREDVERKAWLRLTQPEPAPPAQATVEGFSATYVGTAPAPAPEPHSQSFIGTMLHGPFTGLEIEAMPPQLASYFGAPSGEGLLVQSVANGSPAAVAGFQAGDVILRAGNQPMHTASEWTKQLHASKGKSLTLDVLRDHHAMTMTLESDAKKR
ncbi:MAG TPA: PDZ domain-containing protein [Acidobacteriaceae bacterium]